MQAPAEAPRILLARLSSVGDVVLTTPLIRALRRRHPEAQLASVTRAAFAPLLTHNPHLSRVHAVAPGEPVRALAARLRTEGYTRLLDLHGSLRTRALRRLVRGDWSGYSKRRWAREALIRVKQNCYPDATPEAERYFEAARDLDVRPDGEPPELGIAPETDDAVARWLATGPGEAPFIVVAPGAAHATKRWPLPHWHALIRRLRAAGRLVVVVGGAAEEEAGGDLAAAAAPGAWSACGRFDLQGTGALLRRAAALVAGDTGVAHLAAAVRTPVVLLLGPTVRAFGFLPYRARVEIIERNLACRPCSAQGGAHCPLGHHACLRGITPDRVAGAVERIAS